jgi:hypothetical protein
MVIRKISGWGALGSLLCAAEIAEKTRKDAIRIQTCRIGIQSNTLSIRYR